MLALSSPSQSASLFADTYDDLIREAASDFLPGIDWRLGKAQLFQESRLDPNARSPVGALGLGQFMPGTWGDVTKALKMGLVDRRMVEPSILAWGYYMRQLRQRWKMPDLERHKFALGGYNAGNGNVGRAYSACQQPQTWDRLTECLPQITGRHSKETIGYVISIWKWWKALLA